MNTVKQPKHKRYICVDAVQESLDKLSEIKAWVRNTYSKDAMSWTHERSEGNSFDCFMDGQECGMSEAAWTIGKILGMDLPEPEWEADECE